VRGVALGQRGGDRAARPLPQPDVEPDVRVVLLVRARRRGQQLIARDGVGDRERGLALGQLAEQLAHPALQLQTAVEDQVGLAQRGDVAGAGAEQVRVDARPHQAGDHDPVAADAGDGVGDEVRGRGHLDLAVDDRSAAGRRRGAPGQRGQRDHEPHQARSGHCLAFPNTTISPD
jgi:hypothetical protein